MTIDGCFLIEILRSFKGKTIGDYDVHDPVFSSSGLEGLFTHLIRDMLMIENQLPLVVLERLLGMGNGKTAEEVSFSSFIVFRTLCFTCLMGILFKYYMTTLYFT